MNTDHAKDTRITEAGLNPFPCGLCVFVVKNS